MGELMRSLIMRLVPAVLIIGLMVPSSASAETNRHKYLAQHAKCEKKHGDKCGRNAVHQGLRRKDKTVRDVRPSDYPRLLPPLRRLNEPAPKYLMTKAGPPPNPPAGTMTGSYAPTGLASCIVNAESSGNPTASNGSHSGLAGWSNEAWHRHGGGRYASTPTGATKQQQLQVLSQGLSKYGCRDWCPFNPC